MNELELLGFQLLAGERQAVLEFLWERCQTGQTTHVLTLNPEMIMLAGSKPEVLSLLRQADACVADGVGLEWAADMLQRRGVERYPGIELADDLCGRVASLQGGVFLLGSGPGVAAEAAVRLSTAHPGLRIAGVHDGFLTPADEETLVEQIAASESRLLLVGMGCPRQEEFIVKHRARLNVPLLVGVGGALEVFAGRKQRAPLWIKRSGLEWAYRTMQDVSRLKRLVVLPRFVMHVLGEAWRGRRRQAA